MVYFIVRNIVLLLFKIILHLKVYGRENVPKKGAFILASNHVSYLDPPALSCASPRVLHFMARHDLFNNRAFGALIRALNAFPVKRGGIDPSAFKEAIERLKNGQVLLIFPEGKRSVIGELGAPQPGIGFLSITAEVPILPAYINGTREALPKGARFIKPGPISVSFGKIIEPKNLMYSSDKKEAYGQLANYVMNEIKNLKKERGCLKDGG